MSADQRPERVDVLIRSASVVDGTGAPAFRADIALRDDRIAAVLRHEGTSADAGAEERGAQEHLRAGTEIDAAGLALTPGFIDMHSHDDFAVVADPEMRFKVLQGVTTDVVGNCGMAAVPTRVAAPFGASMYPDHPFPTWSSYGDYLAFVDAEPPSLNVAALIGHGALRAAVLSDPRSAPSTDEIEAMRGTLRDGLADGAVGYSTGLIYDPGRFAATDELIALAREMAPEGGFYATHMRDESAGLLDSIDEAIRIGAEAGVPVQISHHKASGRSCWGRVRESLARIDAARERSIDVTADQYPYTAGSTMLAAVIGGLTGEVDEARRMSPEDVVIASSPHDPALEGRSIAEIASARGADAAATARDVVAQGGRNVWVVMHVMCEEDVETVLRHPSTMIGSDGIPTIAGKPHPRLYGTFARVLGHYVRRRGLLTLEEAVHRMTGLPARRLGLRDRGCIRSGAFADLVLLDPAAIDDAASYADPRRHPRGIRAVWVNGRMVARDGEHTGARPGRALRRAQR